MNKRNVRNFAWPSGFELRDGVFYCTRKLTRRAIERLRKSWDKVCAEPREGENPDPAHAAPPPPPPPPDPPGVTVKIIEGVSE